VEYSCVQSQHKVVVPAGAAVHIEVQQEQVRQKIQHYIQHMLTQAEVAVVGVLLGVVVTAGVCLIRLFIHIQALVEREVLVMPLARLVLPT
jgi:hypothetical protein